MSNLQELWNSDREQLRQVRAQLATATAERDAEIENRCAANRQWQAKWDELCAAHAETRAALEREQAEHCWEDCCCRESTRAELASWRRTAEKLEARVKELEALSMLREAQLRSRG